METCTACGIDLPVGARFCPACAAPVEAATDSRERKMATMVFADLAGSTGRAGAQDPERTRGQLELFYEAMAGEIEIAGGTIEKFAGDAVLAVFGVPAALEDHTERALHSALAMKRRLRELFGEQLALRIGVDTGEVVVGAPRAGSSFVTGDPVNVAARLQQGAEPEEILVGKRAVTLAGGAFEFGPSRTIDAKGKPGGIECRTLVRALSLMRPRGVGDLHRAFVGRDDDLAALERVYEDALSREESRLVTIVGDAGVGKTRLVREFWERLGSTAPETLRHTGRCLSYGRGTTYWPLAEVLKEHLGILDDHPPDEVLARLGSKEILAMTLGLDVAHGLHPLAARDRFQDTWIAFLQELVTDRPLVMLVEDVHWAEEQLLGLLERIVREVRGSFLLVATARAEFLEQHPGWGARAQSTVLELDALGAGDADRLLEGLLGSSLPAGLRDVIVERAEGNPFLVEELLATMIDRGVLRTENGSWRMSALPEDFALPDTVQAVVAARIDLLQPAEKQALQAASVIGRIFWARPVYELVDDVEPDLDVLEVRDFIRRRSGSSLAGDREYAIKHALTREVAYASLPLAKRARLHAAFARWLERTVVQSDEHGSLLAYHYSEAIASEGADLAWEGAEGDLAELRVRARYWLHRAGELAIGRLDVDEGLALLHRALELEPSNHERITLWRAIGRANVLKLDGEAFFAAMLNALEGSDRKTAADTYSELGFQAFTRASMWKQRPDVEMIRDWVDRALELAEADSLARAKALLARANLGTGDDADEALREASELVDRLDDPELRSWVWFARCGAALKRDDYEEAFRWASRQAELAPRLTDLDHASLMYVYAFDPYIATCRLDEARELARAHDRLTATLSAHHRVHAAGLLIEAERLSGRWDAVAEFTERAEDAVAANVDTPCAVNASSLLACALAAAIRGDDRASRRLEASANEIGMVGYDMVLNPYRVELALTRGDLAVVERMLSEWTFPRRDLRYQSFISRLNALAALGRFDEVEQEAPALIRPGTYAEPFALRALGLAREDDELLREAIDRFEAMSLEWHAAQTQRLLTGGS